MVKVGNQGLDDRYIRLRREVLLLGKLGGDVQPASQNPYPIYDQN